MAHAIVLLACLVLPLVLVFYVCKKYKATWWMLLLGMLSFTLSQLVLRIPLLSYLQTNAQFYVFMMNTIPYLLFLSISAALFEESGRWILLSITKKHHSLANAFLFGIGHGMVEAVALVLIPLMTQQPSVAQAGIASLERVLAMSFHICASLWIYYSILNKTWRYASFAYVAHVSFNFFPLLLSLYLSSNGSSNALWMEGVLLIFTLIIIWLTNHVIIKKGAI